MSTDSFTQAFITADEQAGSTEFEFQEPARLQAGNVAIAESLSGSVKTTACCNPAYSPLRRPLVAPQPARRLPPSRPSSPALPPCKVPPSTGPTLRTTLLPRRPHLRVIRPTSPPARSRR